jgi:hypothetical protein
LEGAGLAPAEEAWQRPPVVPVMALPPEEPWWMKRVVGAETETPPWIGRPAEPGEQPWWAKEMPAGKPLMEVIAAETEKPWWAQEQQPAAKPPITSVSPPPADRSWAKPGLQQEKPAPMPRLPGKDSDPPERTR